MKKFSHITTFEGAKRYSRPGIFLLGGGAIAPRDRRHCFAEIKVLNFGLTPKRL